MVDLRLVRRLPPWFANIRKRLGKAPKVFVRDSGLVQALLGVNHREALLGHAVMGASWECFVIESVINSAAADGQPMQAAHYRSAAGTDIDLLLTWPDGRTWAVDVKRSLSTKLERGFYSACDDVRPERQFVVYPGTERYPLAAHVQVLRPAALAAEAVRPT